MGRANLILLAHSLVGERDGRRVVRQETTEIAVFASCRSPMDEGRRSLDGIEPAVEAAQRIILRG